MSDSNWTRHLGRIAMIGGCAAAFGMTGAILGGSILARKAVQPTRQAEAPVVVSRMTRTSAQHIVWLRGEDSNLPGHYSYLFDGGAGHARLGEILDETPEGSTAREVLTIDRGDLRVGAHGRITGWWFTDPDQLGFRVERITYATELGHASAWIIHPRRARKRRWAVHVHGRGAPPEETLRGVGPLARAGITSLVISYRNDESAPRGNYGRYGIGIAESRDVDAAIAEACRRGAKRITLFGWSMGGTASLVAATYGPHTGMIDGLILDSPAVDWATLLKHHAAFFHAPQLVAAIGIHLLDTGIVRGGEPDGIPFDRLTPAAFAERLEVPVLIHASTSDTFVPCDGSRQLAEARPDLVQLRLQTTGEHVKLWNVASMPWERATEEFARTLPRPPRRRTSTAEQRD